MRTLWLVDQERVSYFIFALTPLVGAAAWLGSGGEVGASDGMITVIISRMRWHSLVPGMIGRGRANSGS